MTGLLRGAAIAWIALIWIGSCVSAAQKDMLGWLLLWIFLPPVAWAGEILISLGHALFYPGSRAPALLTVFFLTGWIAFFVAADYLER